MIMKELLGVSWLWKVLPEDRAEDHETFDEKMVISCRERNFYSCAPVARLVAWQIPDIEVTSRI